MGFKNLGVIFDQKEVSTQLIPFLESFKKHNITEIVSEEFEFFKLLLVFYCMTKDSTADKAIVITY
jgi:hypothetical protein